MIEGPGGGDGDAVVAGEEAGVDVDLGEIEELESDLRQFVLLGSRAEDVGVDQTV